MGSRQRQVASFKFWVVKKLGCFGNGVFLGVFDATISLKLDVALWS